MQATAAALRKHGATSSTRVAIALPNGPEMATAFLGVAACAVCVPLNPGYQKAEFRSHLADSHARVVVVPHGQQAEVREIAQEMGIGVLEIESNASLPAGQFHFRGSPAGASNVAAEPGSPHDVALILRTSGTTARPKTVPLSHANLVTAARNIALHLALRPTDRCLNVMPLFHIHGLVGALMASVAGGASIVCIPGYDDRAFFNWIAQFEPTWYTAVPTIHQSVIAVGARYRKTVPNHRFRFIRSSSSPLPLKIFDALQALTGAPVIEAYGMTEASHQMASSSLSGKRKAGSVGVPTGVEIGLMDDAGRMLPAGAPGEIAIRGPTVTAGYENNPHANAEAFSDGWFRTGDLGRFDEEGYLFITGRLKEIVNRGGEKISPREIDEALLEHPEVAQAAAFAVPHPTLGEDLVAAVVLHDAAHADESGVRHFLQASLANFKIPSRIVFVDAIPKEATGKIQRNRLYEKLGNLLSKAHVAPRTDVERALESIVRSVLHCGPIGVDDNFFSLGGDSLRGGQVAARIRTRLGVEIAVPALFSHPTIATLAVEIEAAKEAVHDRQDVLAAEIEQLSDEEVSRLLAQEEAELPWTDS
jgi:acyl-CoA synthetase (AMP-forming)/AMP-acid ligase II